MKKSLTTTIALLGVFLSLLLWNLWYENRVRPKRTESEENEKKLLSLSKEDIQEIWVQRIKGGAKSTAEKHDHDDEDEPEDKASQSKEPKELEQIQLKKTGTDWNLITPVSDLADNNTVETWVSTLTTTKNERVVEETPKDLEPFGLKNPILTIRVQKDSSTKPQTILLGKDTPTGYSIYAKVEGSDRVLRVPRNLRTTFEKEFKEIRNRRILKVERAEVSEVEMAAGKENTVLKKDDKDNWTLARDGLPVENSEWNKTLNALVDAQATQFASESDKNLSPFGLERPAAKVWLKSNKTQLRIGVWFGESKGKVFAKREDRPVIFEVDKEILNKVKQKPSTYQSMRLSNFNRFEINRIQLERKTGKLELVKNNSTWTNTAKPQDKLDTTKVDNLLIAIQDGKISRYKGLNEKSSIELPELTVRLFEKKEAADKEKVLLKFGNRKDKEMTAERGDLVRGFFIKIEDFNKINVQDKDLILVEEKKEETKAGNEKS